MTASKPSQAVGDASCPAIKLASPVVGARASAAGWAGHVCEIISNVGIAEKEVFWKFNTKCFGKYKDR